MIVRRNSSITSLRRWVYFFFLNSIIYRINSIVNFQSINFISRISFRKKCVIFSRIYLKSLRKYSIYSISLSLKTYWYKYLNFKFLLIIEFNYFQSIFYKDLTRIKLLIFDEIIIPLECVKFYYKWNYIFFSRRKIYLETINLKIK